jgi:hypothetical protein
MRRGDYQAALQASAKAAALPLTEEARQDLTLLEGFAYAVLDQPAKAAGHLKESFPAGHRYHAVASRLSSTIESDYPETRNPNVAAALSVVPGLGQAYAGFYKEAAIAFLVNAVIGAFAYDAYRRGREIPDHGYASFTAWMLLEIPFYFGNIYNAGRLTKQANDKAYRDYYEKLEGEDYERALSAW